VALQVDQQLACLQVPDLNKVVLTSRGDPFTIRAKSQRINTIRVAFVRENTAFPSQVP